MPDPPDGAPWELSRQLLALYEHIKRCYVDKGMERHISIPLLAEGWRRPDGIALSPETVTQCDLNARDHAFNRGPSARVGLTGTARGGVSVKTRSEVSNVSDDAEITCTNEKSAAKLRKTTDGAVAYWHCHLQCGGKTHVAGAAHAHAAASSSSWPRTCHYLPESDHYDPTAAWSRYSGGTCLDEA